MFKSCFWFSFYPSLIWFLIILVGSFLPLSSVKEIEISDRLIHFVFYSIFSFLMCHNVTLGLDTFFKKWVYVLIILTTVGLVLNLFNIL